MLKAGNNISACNRAPNSNYVSNRYPLMNTPFIELPLGSVCPAGWFLNQLKIQADGLTGHLDEIWEFVNSNSGWLGGTGENWERGPYYCDGLIPLAYLLEDERLIKKVTKWMEWTLNSQMADGNFGPADNLDWWPRMVMLKVLVQYYEVTEDNRVIELMKGYFRYQKDNIEQRPLLEWDHARAGDNILCVLWLYNRTGEGFLLDLASVLFKQGLDWTDIFTSFPYTKPIEFYYKWSVFSCILPNRFDGPEHINFHTHHVVDVAMGVKNPGLYWLLSGNDIHKKAAEAAVENLDRYHGQVTGVFSGDEHLSGKNPIQGTELCAVVEYMFSLQTLLRTYEDVQYADRLEKIAYNALPAAITKDMWAHQYDQQANQVLVTLAKRDWYDNGDESNLFGLEPNYGCCTANMHQGWPKFVKNFWLATPDRGLAAVVYAPCTADAKVADGISIKIIEETEYPFDGVIRFTIKCKEPVEFPLKLRIPGWCNGAWIEVDGSRLDGLKKGSYHSIIRNWSDGDSLILYLPMKVRTTTRFNNSISIERGPLVFALRIKEDWEKISGTEPYADWEVYPASPWNYALLLETNYPESHFTVETREAGYQPFDSENPPVIIKAKGKRLKEWKLENNSAGTLPVSPVTSDEPAENIILIPYGAAKLRVSEFPYIELKV